MVTLLPGVCAVGRTLHGRLEALGGTAWERPLHWHGDVETHHLENAMQRDSEPETRSATTTPRALAAAFEEILRHAAQEGRTLPLRDWLDLAEAWRIEQALRETRGNRSAAARALGIGRRTLYAKMHKLGL